MKKTLFTFTVFIAMLLTSCMEEDVNLAVYKVSCSSENFRITYHSYNGEETKASTKKNWSTTFSVDPGDSVYVSAFTPDSNATISAEIYYDGETLATESISGDSITVSVGAIIP